MISLWHNQSWGALLWNNCTNNITPQSLSYQTVWCFCFMAIHAEGIEFFSLAKVLYITHICYFYRSAKESADMSTPLDKVRVLIVGDSETGKTSLAQLIAHGLPVERPMSTIGCSAQVKLHDYRAGKESSIVCCKSIPPPGRKSLVCASPLDNHTWNKGSCLGYSCVHQR